MPQRWKISKVINGKRTVRTRVNGIFIGSISYGKSSRQFYANRPTGEMRRFGTRFDACAWLMDFFDAQESIAGKQAC